MCILQLPIDQYKFKIIDSVRENVVTIITAPTGSGKSTRVPQFILDSDPNSKIVVTQPRRVAAISLAQRVLSERGLPSLESGSDALVSYHIGRDCKVTSGTRLTYMTTGVLLRKLISAGNMKEYTHIILDEVHERDKETDFVLLLVKKFLSPDVRIIVMSATVNADKFSRYFGPQTPIIKIVQEIHSVDIFYYDEIQTQTLGLVTADQMKEQDPQITHQMYQTASDLIQYFDHSEQDQRDKGSVLVFLPGIFEIDTLYKILVKHSSLYTLITLHSSIARSSQMSVFNPPLRGHRKIILSTNIAESSITVPDVKYVIDFCLSKEMNLNPGTGLSSLQYRWAPLSSLDQRKGRAGRVSNGQCYRLINKSFLTTLEDWPTPEIIRCSLEHLILWCKVLLANDGGAFQSHDSGEPMRVEEILSMALDPPDQCQVYKSMLLLLEVGALNPSLDPGNSDLTFLGHMMSIMPLDVKLTRLVMFGLVFDCLYDCVVMAACLSAPSFLDIPHNDKRGKLESYKVRLKASNGTHSDPIMLLNMYYEWSKTNEKQAWCTQNYVQSYRIEEVASIIKEIESCLLRAYISLNPSYTCLNLPGNNYFISLKLALAAANYPHYYLTDDIDKKDCMRLFGDKSPTDTVVFTGMKVDVKSDAELQTKYLGDVSDFYSGFEPIKSMSLERSRMYVTFENNSSQGTVSTSVLYALKMSKLGLKLRLSNKYSRPTCSNIIRLKAGLMQVAVTHIVSVSKFFVQLIEPTVRAQWEKSMVELQSIERVLLPDSQMKGLYAAAVFAEDDLDYLYRVRVEAVITGYIKVYYIDYGNSCWIPSDSIYTLPPHFLDPPFQALECSLENIQELEERHEENVQYLNTILVNRYFEVKILYLFNNILYIDLIKEGFSLKTVLKSDGRIAEREEDFDTELARMTIGVGGSESIKLDSVAPAEFPRCGVNPSGPISPYEATFSALIGVMLSPVADRDSVNSILVCEDSTCRQVLSASSVALAGSRQVVTLRGTTYHDPIPGLAEMFVMLFAPRVQLISSQPENTDDKTEYTTPSYTGFLAGLGADNYGDPLLPEHDIRMNFSVHFDDVDLDEISKLRKAFPNILSSLSPGELAWSAGGLRNLQLEVMDRVCTMLYRVRDKVTVQPNFHWSQIVGWSGDKCILDTGLKSLNSTYYI